MNYCNISEETIVYVEENLCDELTLEAISRHMNYSKYHFHRLFLSEMGVSVANYIRRRRIMRSTYALAMLDTNILKVAHDYGFTNIDTYIRCFKRFYGITPTEYRKLSKRLTTKDHEECVRMRVIEKDLRKCTLEDKQNVISSLEKMIELSKIAHKEGLLSLENYVEKSESIFLKTAIDLLLDGTEPQTLRKILLNYIMTSELTPKELLERVIYLEGTISLQNGDYPWEMRKKLSSYFGENFINVLDLHFTPKNISIGKLEEYKNKAIISSKTFLIENELKNIDKRSMQRLLRECDLLSVAIAFEGAGKELRRLLIESLSESQQNIFAEIMGIIGEPNIPKIVDSQNDLVRIIKELRRNNDIK